MLTKGQKIGIAYWIGYIVFICFYFYFDTIDQYRNSEKVEGVVVDQLIGRGRKRGEFEYPQFQFIYKDSAYLFAEESGFIRPGIGKKVTVIFPKGEPGRAEKYSFFSYWISLTKLFFSFMISLFLFMIPVFLSIPKDAPARYYRRK